MINPLRKYVDLKTPTARCGLRPSDPAAPGRYPRARAVLRDLPGDRSHPQDRRLSCRPRNCCSAGNLPRAGGGSWCCPRLRHGGRRTRQLHKITKELASTDADARAVLDFLADHPSCTGKLGSIRICVGGHLSFRAFNPDVRAAACFYATDIHTRSRPGYMTTHWTGSGRSAASC